MKPLVSACLMAILISALISAGNTNFGTVNASTEVTGIISADTTWANSLTSLRAIYLLVIESH